MLNAVNQDGIHGIIIQPVREWGVICDAAITPSIAVDDAIAEKAGNGTTSDDPFCGVALIDHHAFALREVGQSELHTWSLEILELCAFEPLTKKGHGIVSRQNTGAIQTRSHARKSQGRGPIPEASSHAGLHHEFF